MKRLSTTKHTSTFLDLKALWEHAQAHPAEGRLRAILREGGVAFHDEACDFVRSSHVAIVGVGGIPVQLRDGALMLLGQPVSTLQLQASFQEMMGYCGFMSYLNPQNKTPAALADTMGGLGHFSTAHAISVNLLVMGISCAVENELNVQRDLVHLSRLTVARTRAQDAPPLVVLNEEALPMFREIRAKTLALLEGQTRDRECHNNLFPAAKATMVLLSGTLRNFQKLVSAQDDPGKEREFRQVLSQIHARLQLLAPSLFPGPVS